MVLRDKTHPAGGPGSAENAQVRGAREQINHTTNRSIPPPKTALQQALERAEAGISGFWIPKNDKRPRCQWKAIETTDPAEIRRQRQYSIRGATGAC